MRSPRRLRRNDEPACRRAQALLPALPVTARGAPRMQASASIGRIRVFDIVLYEPEIPPNTGNIMRLCANAGARLHLIEPLGFRLTERQLRRAGLDYADKQHTTIHRDWSQCRRSLADGRWFAVSTRGRTA